MSNKKIGSVLLALCFLAGLFPFSLAANADEGTAGVYYVMYGKTGDGKTEENPMGSIKDAIAAIESDESVTEGTVYIRNNPEFADNYLPADSAAHQYASWEKPAAHEKLIHIKGADENSATVLMNTAKCDTGDIEPNGPLHFSNITLARTRTVGEEGIMTGGFDVTFDRDVRYYTMDKEPSGNNWKIPEGTTLVDTDKLNAQDWNKNSSFIHLGSGRSASSGKGGRVTITAKAGNGLILLSDRQGGTYENDVTVALSSQGSVHWEMTGDGKTTTYKKNLNLVLGYIKWGVGFYKSYGFGGNNVVEGDLQIIHAVDTVKDVNLSGINMTVKGNTYDIACETAGLLDVTDRSGVYTVADGKTVYAYNGGDKIYYNAKNTLTVPVGNWNVTTSRDTAISATTPEDGTEWNDNGIGVISAENAATVQTEWFVQNGGNGDGKTRNTAMGSLMSAINAIENAGLSEATIYVIDATSSSGKPSFVAWPEMKTVYKAKITIAGADGNASHLALHKYYGGANAAEIALGGPTVFENITLFRTRQYDNGVCANGYDLTIGENVRFQRTPTDTSGWDDSVWDGTTVDDSLTVKIGVNYPQYNTFPTRGNGGVVTIGSGTPGYATRVDIPSASDGGRYSENISVYVNRADDGVRALFGAKANGVVTTYEKNLNLVFGNVPTVTLAGQGGAIADSVKILGGFQVILPSSATFTNTASDYISAEGGAWIVKTETAGLLDVTETAGTFLVNGTENVVGYQNGKIVAGSKDGILILPKGTTEVKSMGDIQYVYSDDTVTFYTDKTDFDIEQIEPDSKEGKVFLGFVRGDGTAPEKISDYKAGDVLTAQYADFDTADETGDFYILGAQIRKGSETVEQGLRFVIRRNDSAYAVLGGKEKIIEQGSLILPTDFTRGHDMRYGKPLTNEYEKALPEGVSTTTWTNGSWSSENGPAAVPAKAIFREDEKGQDYTVCVTGIDETRYGRYYTVKGYIRYADANGAERVAYTEYYQTSLAAIAKAAVAAGETDDAIKKAADYYDTERKTAYLAENYENRTDLRDVAEKGTLVSWADTEGKASLSGITNTGFYKLANGLVIREIEYDLSGESGRTPIEIVQFNDTHLNYINDKDWENKSECILATYKGRSWKRDGSSTENVNRLVEYASLFDQTVVTGDILDYRSQGCLEMTKKLMFDRLPGALFTFGNHESTVHMQEADHICDTEDTLEAAHAELKDVWPNDTKYVSKIISNKDGIEMAMIVAVDNGPHAYKHTEIREGLTRDIAIAREKKIPILLFEHCPISTRGGLSDDKYTWFYSPGDIGSFADGYRNLGKIEAGSRPEDETYALDNEVYSLIVNNADVIRGIFCADWHNYLYTEVKAADPYGNEMMIPQYISNAAAYGNGCAVKITVR